MIQDYLSSCKFFFTVLDVLHIAKTSTTIPAGEIQRRSQFFVLNCPLLHRFHLVSEFYPLLLGRPACGWYDSLNMSI